MRFILGVILLPIKIALLVPFLLIGMALGLVGLVLGLPFGFGVLGLLGTVLWLSMLAHVILNDRLTGGARLAWVLVVWLLPFVGATLYFFLGRSGNRDRVLTV